ncbi:MAG: BlaI/MecI/CopY family transcriptional regulator [Faecousia sp.]
MDDLRLGAVESRFADIIWSHEPLSSRELVILCEKELRWKKSTTYTVLKRLCDKGLFRNESGMVSSRMTKEEYASAQSEKFVEDTFGGSLPAFMAAFTKRKPLTDSDIAEIQRMIQQMGRE